MFANNKRALIAIAFASPAFAMRNNASDDHSALQGNTGLNIENADMSAQAAPTMNGIGMRHQNVTMNQVQQLNGQGTGGHYPAPPAGNADQYGNENPEHIDMLRSGAGHSVISEQYQYRHGSMDDIPWLGMGEKRSGFERFCTSKTVWGLGLAGTAGTFAGFDLAAINPGHEGSNVFTGHNIEVQSNHIQDGKWNDGGWILAIAMMTGVSLGLMFLVMSLTPEKQHGLCFYRFMYLSTLLGSASLMVGLNFIQTNASDLGTAIIGGLKNIDVQAVDATHVVEHNHGLPAQILLIGGSILFGTMLLCLIVSQGQRLKAWCQRVD